MRRRNPYGHCQNQPRQRHQNHLDVALHSAPRHPLGHALQHTQSMQQIVQKQKKDIFFKNFLHYAKRLRTRGCNFAA